MPDNKSVLSYEVTGLYGVKGRLRFLSSSVLNGNPELWRNVAQVLRACSMNCFRAQKTPDGVPWKPLKKATLEARAERVTGRMKKHGKAYERRFSAIMRTGKILLDTGRLRASVSTRYDGNSAEVGSMLNYARTQQMGDSRRHIPARPFLGVSRSALQEIKYLMRKQIERSAAQ